MKENLHGSFIDAQYCGIRRFIKLTAITEIPNFYDNDTTDFKVGDCWWSVKGISPQELLAIINNYEQGSISK